MLNAAYSCMMAGCCAAATMARALVLPLLLASTQASGPVVAPGQRYDLRDWQLQTCLQSPRVVSNASLVTYTDKNFFLSGDGAIVMITPDNASAMTTHSTHPRTEFRETGFPDWHLDAGSHAMNLTTAVARVSNTTGETIIMQIHGSVDEEIAKVLKLRWTRTQLHHGKVEARVKKTVAPYAEIGLDCGTYALNATLDVQVVVSGAKLTVTVNGKSAQYAPPFNKQDTYYFKAGDYSQCKPCGTVGEYAEVRLSKLSTRHDR